MSKLSRKCCSFRTTESKTEAKGHLFIVLLSEDDYQSPSLLPCIKLLQGANEIHLQSPSLLPCIWPLQAANGVHLPRAELQCYLFSLPQMQEHRTEGLRTRKRDPAVWNASPFWLLLSCCSYGRVLKHKTHPTLTSMQAVTWLFFMWWLPELTFCTLPLLLQLLMSPNQKETWRDGKVRWDYHESSPPQPHPSAHNNSITSYLKPNQWSHGEEHKRAAVLDVGSSCWYSFRACFKIRNSHCLWVRFLF